ncbi:glycoside hydrolase family 99-like domain-containing protein [Clostridium tagluense]|uniref:glycosyltransferase WbsX family protein n=1 Tax=Clostridium tagluense TaxID=360422 RepID=UPI001CF49187|nr:glycoside hydrolase family 99-like domain-containing protein [Clostridium tagluense]MCB2312027.1 glycoside hydrolase family 99-like domain-containing protein [Clostridium tagluense]MCB2316614.1 glycoside hydrolase family 99-like domain-containing protein [Clostridium tagluense]MCB2321450.1 glycoside hydrolase family 99-like domain-containing protein [Clostridium tagluense]MCB2326462.1 glycoside hydrolase family 99-like domain-containing protein [Clostridium tagluense]MCB2331206.1 glycoside 
MKIIAFYLPQFHEIPENNEWWGKGFTEWTNVKTAKPTFKNQYQPRKSLNNNYYNLTDSKSLEWQAKTAKAYGVYGFCYYHYWFEGKMLLERPAEIMLDNLAVDIPFCFCWANHTWRREWANKSNSILIEQTYGAKEDWTNHFNYLLPFFKDERYMKEDGKPIMVLYNPKGVKEFPEMMRLWQKLAKDNGLAGLVFIHQENAFDQDKEKGGDLFSYGIEFQPNDATHKYMNDRKIRIGLMRFLNRVADKIPLLRCKATTLHFDYDEIWKNILEKEPKDSRWLPGAFVDWDNTPRRKNRGNLCTGVTPEKFEKYLTIQIKRAREIYNSDKLFMFAWNEWGESGYLEPDERYGYKILEAVKKSLIANDELEVK